MPSQKLGTIVVALRLEDRHLEAIRAVAPGAEVVRINGRDEWRVRRAELESTVEVIAGVQGSDHLDLASMPRLRWIQTGGAGNDWLIRSPEIVNSDVMVTNGSGVAAIPIAEHVLAMMFALSRQIPRFTRSQLDHEWYRGERLAEVDGSTMGIVGLGAIGEKTAEKARGLNMRVLGLRRDPTRRSPHVDRMLGPDGLVELLEVSDWVVLASALTSRTHGLIGEPELRAMKDTACLINIARGALVQEKVLVRALQEGWIGGAGLDVFEREPLPPDSPLWDMDNVLISSHYSHSTPHYNDRLAGVFIENLRRYRAGEPMINVVDKQHNS